MKTYKGLITELKKNQIFVFGSNKQGIHGAGTAKIAYNKYGATIKQAKGLHGQSYGLITVDLIISERPSICRDEIIKNILELYEFAKNNSELEFLIAYTADGFNLNGYTSKEMANMFKNPNIPENIIFEDKFYKLINNK